MKKITKPDGNQIRTVAAFGTVCGCTTCHDCVSNASAAQALAYGTEASISHDGKDQSGNRTPKN